MESETAREEDRVRLHSSLREVKQRRTLKSCYQTSLPTGETSRLDFAVDCVGSSPSVMPQRTKHTLMLKLKKKGSA